MHTRLIKRLVEKYGTWCRDNIIMHALSVWQVTSGILLQKVVFDDNIYCHFLFNLPFRCNFDKIMKICTNSTKSDAWFHHVVLFQIPLNNTDFRWLMTLHIVACIVDCWLWPSLIRIPVGNQPNWGCHPSYRLYAPTCPHGPLVRYAKLRVRMNRECRKRIRRHRGWAIPSCITALASRTCHDACRDR